MERSDLELVLACRRGDQLAWEELIRRYQRLVYAIPRRAGLTEDESAEVFQVGVPSGSLLKAATFGLTNYFGQTVTKLRGSDGFNLGTFQVGDGAAGIAFDGTNMWVVNNGDSTVMKVSPSSGSVVATYGTGKGPFSVTFDGSRIWVPNFGSNSVSTTAAN